MPEKLHAAPMVELTVVPKKIGGSIAVFLPAEVAKREGIEEGVPVRIIVEKQDRTAVVGFLKGKLPYEPFDRHKEGLWPEK